MASQIEILLKAKNETDAAFNAVIKSLKDTTKEQEKTSKAAETLSQRAGKVADAFGKTATKMAAAGSALGLPTQALRTLDDVAGVAEIGFENLSKSAAGFNAASVGVAGAGLAIGVALGTLARQIPIVAESADRAAEALFRMFGANIPRANEMAEAATKFAEVQKQIAAANEKLLRSQSAGKSAKEIQELFFPEPPKGIRQRILDEAKAREDGAKKAEAAAKKAAAEAEKLRAAWQKASEDARIAWDKFYENIRSRSGLMLQEQKSVIAQMAEENVKKAMLAMEATQKEQEAFEDLVEAYLSGLDRIREEEEARQDRTQEFADALGTLADLLQDFGLSADNAFVSVLNGFANGITAALEFEKATTKVGKAIAAMHAAQAAFNSGSALGGAATGAAFGAGFGPWGAAIGAVAGGLLGLFGGAKKAREEMEKLKAQFISSQGGMTALAAKAKEAGIALDAMFKAKSAAQLQQAIARIQEQLDSWGEAQDRLREAMEKYGISVEQMGPAFAQQELDKKVAELVEAFALLTTAGADASMVAQRMGGDVLALVRQYQAAGLAIPEALRPVLEAMLANGQLVDENGEAYASLEDAGIKFAESMTAAMDRLMEQVQRLVEALARGFNIPVNFNYNHNGSGTSPQGGAPGGNPRHIPESAEGSYFPPGARQLTWIAEGGSGGKQGEFAIPRGMLQGMMQNAAMAAARAVAMSGSSGGGGVADAYMDGTKVGKVLLRKNSVRRSVRAQGRR